MMQEMQGAADDAAEGLLVDYASGALPEPVSVLIATQLALRPDLRRTVAEFEEIGGAVLENMEPVALSGSALETALAAISANDDGMPEAGPGGKPKPGPGLKPGPDAATAAIVPEPLRSRLGGALDRLAWRRRGPGIEEVHIPVGDPRFRMSLMRFRPGRSVPAHSHEGDELTLVLDGSFRDGDGCYRRGDLALKAAHEEHAPKADPDHGCICLALTGGPPRFSNPLIGWYDRLTRE